jgi:tRNA (guanine-N7-)-methyltransferase
MGKKRDKLKRYDEVSKMQNVTECPCAFDAKKTKIDLENIFGNDHPRILELACGKGDYTLALAERNPENNYIGMDIKGARIWKGAKIAEEKKLENVHFVRGYVDHITEFFDEGTFDEIWITFADPHPTKKGAKKRLSHERFLEKYKQILKPTGILHIKIDDDQLFEFSKESLKNFGAEILMDIWDVYAEEGVPAELTEIQTYYEKMHLKRGRTIHYLKAKL